jgi:hypothetical protein
LTDLGPDAIGFFMKNIKLGIRCHHILKYVLNLVPRNPFRVARAQRNVDQRRKDLQKARLEELAMRKAVLGEPAMRRESRNLKIEVRPPSEYVPAHRRPNVSHIHACPQPQFRDVQTKRR